MISDAEKRRFLVALADRCTAGERTHQMLMAIADDYGGPDSIDSMRPFFEAQVALGKSVTDLMAMTGAERHRIIFALTSLGITAKGMKS